MKTTLFRSVSGCVALMLLLSSVSPLGAPPVQSSPAPAEPFSASPEVSADSPGAADATARHIRQALGQLPLYFVENQGQLDERVAYTIQGSDKTLYFTSEGVLLKA